MTTIEIPAEGLSISAAAEASGLSVDTLRYYEKEGLTLQPPERSTSGQRRYAEVTSDGSARSPLRRR